MGTMRIISKTNDAFGSREEAGRLLGKELKAYRNKNTVVLGIPRGGIIIARELARYLNAELDIVLSRKLGAPGNPELAIGAVCEDGSVFLNEPLASQIGDEEYISREKKRQLSELKKRIGIYRKVRPKVALKAKTVIITDDGIATGVTMQAALLAARKEKPDKLIVAVPVASKEALDLLSLAADEIICLRLPFFFASVGQFYLEFRQVKDKEVLEILKIMLK